MSARYLLPSLVLVLGIFTGNARSPHPMDGWIHPSVQGPARRVLRRELALLPAQSRENVTFVDLDGTRYANQPQGDLELYRPTEDPTLYVSTGGEQAVFPPPGPQQTAAPRQMNPDVLTRCLGDTGAYRRMFTKEGGRYAPTRYTYIAADFSVRGGDASTIKIADPDKDVAFVFLGGNGTNGWWLDAGLQYSPLRKDWALFIRDRGKALKSQDGRGDLPSSPELSPTLRFAPDQTITVEMFVPQKPVFGARRPLDNRVAVVARGRQRDNGSVRGGPQVRSYIIAVPGGWPRDGFDGGHGINLRHTVSIAQKGALDFTTGSYFKGTEVTNTWVGTSYATRRPLRPSDVQQRCSFPNDDVVQTRGSTVDIVYDPAQWR